MSEEDRLCFSFCFFSQFFLFLLLASSHPPGLAGVGSALGSLWFGLGFEVLAALSLASLTSFAFLTAVSFLIWS